MGFVSQLEKANIKSRQGAKKLPPFIVFRASKSGACCGNLNRSMPFRGERIDVEIDEDLKQVRIGKRDDGYSVEKKGGQFSCSIDVFKILGGKRIFLELSDDGWWYGRYD